MTTTNQCNPNSYLALLLRSCSLYQHKTSDPFVSPLQTMVAVHRTPEVLPKPPPPSKQRLVQSPLPPTPGHALSPKCMRMLHFVSSRCSCTHNNNNKCIALSRYTHTVCRSTKSTVGAESDRAMLSAVCAAISVSAAALSSVSAELSSFFRLEQQQPIISCSACRWGVN